MKKIILYTAIIATIAFAGCSNDDDEGTSCKTCEDIAGFEGLNAEICDNGDGTATVTSTFLGNKTSEEIDLEGESISDLPCSDLSKIDFGI